MSDSVKITALFDKFIQKMLESSRCSLFRKGSDVWMSRRSADLGSGKVGRLLWQLSLPVIMLIPLAIFCPISLRIKSLSCFWQISWQ